MYLPNDPVAEAHYNQNDVEKAKQLLEESGYQGEELIWNTTRDWEDHYLNAVAITDQLKEKLGLNIELEVYDAASMLGKMEEESGWHFALGQYGSYNFFPMVLDSFWNCESTSSLNAGYCNPELDAAFEAAIRAVTDAEEEAAFREVQRIFWEDLPNIKMYEAPSVLVVRKEVKNYAGWYRSRFFSVWLEQ